MTGEPTLNGSKPLYGPITFLVAVLHLFVVEVATWLLMPYSIVVVLPVVLVYMAISALVLRAPGRWGQVGRGMMIGSLSGPLSFLIFIPAFIVAQAIGPI